MFNISTMADLICNPPRRSRSRTRTPTPTPTTTPTTTTPETDTETPPTKPTDHLHLNQHFNYNMNNPHNNHSKIILSFTNGGIKRHHPKIPSPPPVVVVYKECLKNHAASLGGHVLDGCGEFMQSPTPTAVAAISNNNHTLLKCAACGCHRNFHRREPDINEYPLRQNLQLAAAPVPRLQDRERSPNSSVSPPPISSTYYPSSAPHMLLALSAGNLSSGPPSDHPQQEQHHHNRTGNTTTNVTVTTTTTPPAGNAKYSNGGGGSSRKRFRTKFTEEQKHQMHNFSEKLGWKLQKRDDNLIAEFCNEVGVGRSVLKVWMHNNKNSLGKVNLSNSISSINLHNTNTNTNNNHNGSTSPSNNHNHHHQVHHHQHSGSSSSD